MMAMLRSAVLVLGLASCVSTPLPASPYATAAAGATDRHGERCSLDADCPNGSCRAGTCSWVAAGEPEREVCKVEPLCYGDPRQCRNTGICARWEPSFGPRTR